MVIQIFEISDTTDWDRQISQMNGSLFLTRVFLKSIEDKDIKPVFFEFRKEDETIGRLSGIIRPVGKTTAKQLFFFSGVAGKYEDPNIVKECKRSLLEYAREKGYSRILFESYDNMHFRRMPVKSMIKARDREEYVIDLTQKTEKTIKAFDPNVRRLTRRANEKGAVLKTGNSQKLLEELYEILHNTAKERLSKGYGKYDPLSMPFLGKDNLLKLLQTGLAEICYIDYKGDILCMQYNLVIGNVIYGLFMGTRKEGYKIAAPSMLIFEATLQYIKKGFTRYNLGGVPREKINQGIKKFKLSMGAKVIKSNQEYSKFLLPPLSRLNSILTFKRYISNMRIPWVLKKRLIALTDLLLKGTDRY